MKKSLIIIILMLLLLGCKSPYQSINFDVNNLPAAPDYSQTKSWAVLPQNYPPSLLKIVGEGQEHQTDVFYIYPTLLTDRNNTDWNADIWDPKIRNKVLGSAIKYQASAWGAAANIYAPFYRQAHYRVFVEPFKSQGVAAWEIAYEDVKSAFLYYLEHYNSGKPIIIAAHSQGSMHAKRLLADFFDDKPLQKQLVAAYLIGTKLSKDTYKTIRPMEQPDTIGGFVSWNSYKLKKLPKSYETYFKNSVTTNPITWNGLDKTNFEDHKGVLYTDTKIYPQSLKIERINGLIWVSLPKIPKRLLFSFIKNYHYADINLFWGDIRENAKQRAANWHKIYGDD